MFEPEYCYISMLKQKWCLLFKFNTL